MKLTGIISGEFIGKVYTHPGIPMPFKVAQGKEGIELQYLSNSETFCISSSMLDQEVTEILGGTKWDRAEIDSPYYFIGFEGSILECTETSSAVDQSRFDNYNYCTDKETLKALEAEQYLHRRIVQFRDKNDIAEGENKYTIYYSIEVDRYITVCDMVILPLGAVVFNSRNVAKQCITNVIEPALKFFSDQDINFIPGGKK